MKRAFFRKDLGEKVDKRSFGKKMKKAISPVVSTILLILISISAVLLIAGFVIPFVRDSLAKSKECFEVAEQLKINTEGKFTFYNITTQNASIQIGRGTKDAEIKGFILGVYGADSKTFEIYNGVTLEGIKMFDGTTQLEIPKIGEERTYTIDLNVVELNVEDELRAKISPIMKSDRKCEVLDEAKIPKKA